MRKVHLEFARYLDWMIKSLNTEIEDANDNLSVLKNYEDEGSVKNKVIRAEKALRLETAIEGCQLFIDCCIDIRNGIKSNGFCSFLNDFGIIYKMMYANVNKKLKFDEEEQVALIGMIIRNNGIIYGTDKEVANWINKVDKEKKPFAKACLLLKDFFNEDGSLIPYSDKTKFKEGLQTIFSNCSGNEMEVQQGLKKDGHLTYDEFISMALRVLDKTNENNAKLKEEQFKLAEERELAIERSLQNRKETEMRIKNCHAEYKTQRQQDAIKRNAILELSRYYLDGEFITIPPEANTLVALLNSAGYNAERIKKILDKRDTYINEIEHRRIYLKYLTEDEYDLYLKAVKIKDNLTLNNIISDLDSAIMLEEELEEKDEEFQNEINELVMQMQTIMKNINLTFN